MRNTKITIKDVARLAGTSVTTVSNVINGMGRVSNETKQRVLQVVEQLEFAPSTAARNLRDKRSSLIAVVVPYIESGKLMDNPFYWQLVTGIEEGARSQSLHIILVGVESDESFSFVRERQIDGLIVIGVIQSSPILKRIQKLKVPVVFVDSYLEDEQLPQISLDDELGGYIGTKHLLALGHRNIMLLSGKLGDQGVHYYRWLGYKRAIEEAGMQVREELVLEEPVSALSGYRIASVIAAQAAETKISAVFCLSDVTAIGLLKGLYDLGISVPQQLSVMGFDNNDQANYTIPSLTTVHQNIAQKGEQAIKQLIALMDGEEVEKRQIVLGVELLVRQSTARFRG